MSTMIMYGNNRTSSILTDCRITCTMPNDEIKYYERGTKIKKFNKTIIGIIGDYKYAEKIYGCMKNSMYTYFKDSKSYHNAEYETLYDLCVSYARQYNKKFSERQGCEICITGINKENKIVMTYFHTNDFVFHSIIPTNKEYATKAFCNYNEPKIDQKVYNIVNNTKENMISYELHHLIMEDIIPVDNTVNENYCFETISL